EPVAAPATRRRAAASNTATEDAPAEPVAAPATRKRAAASKAETEDIAAEAVTARATRARSQTTAAPVAEEEAPKTRRASRRAAATKTGADQEEEGKGTQAVASDMETAEMEEDATNTQNEEHNEVEEQSHDGQGVVVADTPAQVQEEPPLEEEEDGRQESPAVGVGRRGARRRARPEPVASPATRKKAATRKTVTWVDAPAAEAVPARATRARSQSTVAEEAPKGRRTSRKTAAQQEEEGEGQQGKNSSVASIKSICFRICWIYRLMRILFATSRCL
uniref:Uncharacterized protein n=1 Tax=Aegilops tauschii subsp. strangulata TaxID=200361 RepID=A0A453CVP1_AEGTS